MSLAPIVVPVAAELLVDVLRSRPGAVPRNVVELESELDPGACREQLETLRSLGYEIAAVPGGSYQLLGVPDRLLPNEVSRHLETQWMAQDLLCFEEVDSTNQLARDAARAGAAEGTVVIADAQRRGRGRRGRSWVSPARRNLYLSVVLRPGSEVEYLSLLSLVAGVAVCDAMREWDARAMLKWPNDVLIDRRKVAGILTEVEGEGDNRSVVLGIGANLNAGPDDFPEELHEKAGSLRLATGREVDRPLFTARVLFHLERRYAEWRAGEAGSPAVIWSERSCLNGRRVTVQEPDGQISGVVLGLDEDGALRLDVGNATEHRVVAGDVTVAEWD